jgi:ketosteroid isomerase-like protein
VTPELMDKARAGLDAWQRGDFAALEELLDPVVELVWWESGSRALPTHAWRQWRQRVPRNPEFVPLRG